MTWTTGKDNYGRIYRERSDGYREYQLNPEVAELVLNIKSYSTWRSLSIAVTGFECQMTGRDLERLAKWTLGKEEDEYE
jgi:hypothetical protein